jgi:hypothetical protein
LCDRAVRAMLMSIVGWRLPMKAAQIVFCPSSGHINASHATPRIALAKQMASRSDSFASLTAVFIATLS